jgi:hypothetical protein
MFEIASLETSENPDRNDVMSGLLPKILGIVREKATDEQGPMIKIARLSNDLEVSFCLLSADRIMLGVYWPVKFKTTKVLSLHIISDAGLGDPNSYRYCDGLVSVLNWRRGIWEDIIMSDGAASVSISDAF